jgi:hypothetical protein
VVDSAEKTRDIGMKGGTDVCGHEVTRFTFEMPWQAHTG